MRRALAAAPPGVLVVHESEPASYGWATVKNSNTNTMFDIVRQNPASEHTPFEGWIQRDTAVQLFKAAGLDFERPKQAAKRGLPSDRPEGDAQRRTSMRRPK